LKGHLSGPYLSIYSQIWLYKYESKKSWAPCHVEGSCGNFFEIKKYIITVILKKRDRSECVIGKKNQKNNCHKMVKICPQSDQGTMS